MFWPPGWKSSSGSFLRSNHQPSLKKRKIIFQCIKKDVWPLCLCTCLCLHWPPRSVNGCHWRVARLKWPLQHQGLLNWATLKENVFQLNIKKKILFWNIANIKKNFTRNFKHNGISDSQQYSLNLWPIMDDRDNLIHGFPLIVTFVDFKLQTQIFFIVTIKQRLIGYYCESDMPRSITWN